MKYAISIIKGNKCVGYWVSQVDGIYPSRYISKSRLDLFSEKKEAVEQLKYAAWECMKFDEPHLPVICIFQTTTDNHLVLESKNILLEWAESNWAINRPDQVDVVKQMTQLIPI